MSNRYRSLLQETSSFAVVYCGRVGKTKGRQKRFVQKNQESRFTAGLLAVRGGQEKKGREAESLLLILRERSPSTRELLKHINKRCFYNIT